MDTNAMNNRPPHDTDAHRRTRSGGFGFTLVELLVVIGIIVLLIGILLPALGRASAKARQTTTRTTMNEFAKACESFHQEDPAKRAKWPVKFGLKSAHTVVM